MNPTPKTRTELLQLVAEAIDASTPAAMSTGQATAAAEAVLRELRAHGLKVVRRRPAA